MYLIGLEWLIYLSVTAFGFWAIARAEWSKNVRWLAGTLAASLLLGGPLLWGIDAQRKCAADIAAGEAEHQQRAIRYAITKGRFDEHCKSAGIKIYRTAENVEGVFLMKIRGEEQSTETRPQFRLNDPYGNQLDDTRRNYIGSFLRMHYFNPDRGYRYVEIINPKTGERTRYEGRMITNEDWMAHYYKSDQWVTTPCGDSAPANDIYSKFMSCPIPITSPGPRYGVTFDDISTHEDREHWIAGSSLRIIDLQTNEVMAERIGYTMEPNVGIKTSSGLWYYTSKPSCPTPPQSTSDFVMQILKPK
jgi:hypothetical protein